MAKSKSKSKSKSTKLTGINDFEKFPNQFSQYIFSRLHNSEFMNEDGIIMKKDRTLALLPRQSETNPYHTEEKENYQFNMPLIDEAAHILSILENITLTEIVLLTPKCQAPLIMTGRYFEVHIVPRVEIDIKNENEKEEKAKNEESA